MKKKKCENIWLTVAIIILTFAVVLSANSCRHGIVFIPQNELGEIDYYGEIVEGVVSPEVLERIKNKRVEVVSKGFVYRYWEMKKLLESHGLWKWEQ